MQGRPPQYCPTSCNTAMSQHDVCDLVDPCGAPRKNLTHRQKDSFKTVGGDAVHSMARAKRYVPQIP